MAWRETLGRYKVELLLFVLSLGAYAFSSGSLLAHQSLAPHFVYQADAFLHGQLHLTVARPPNLNDWVLMNGRWYVSFPPGPAILMMPFVAIFGLKANDVAFTIVFAAANVALFYRLLRRLDQAEGGGRPAFEHAALSIIFGFGTLAWSCGIRGEVWFTAETVGVTCTLLYLHAALRAAHPAWAGFFLAFGTITRTPLALAFPFFLCEALSPDGPVSWAKLREGKRWREAFPKLLEFAGAAFVVLVPVAIVNVVRFGSPTEFGHSHLYANRVNEQIEKFGLFHYAFLERNLHAAFTRLPEIHFHPLKVGFNGEGMSLFVTTPLLLYLLWPRQKPRLHRALWATVLLVAIPGFFYQNSGWFQFGFRFALDYTPYLILLVAIGGHRFSRLFQVVALAGIVVNAWGAAVFNRLY